MKRIFLILIATISVMILITSCTAYGDPSIQKKESIISDNNNKKNEKNNEIYLGKWLVKRVVAFAKISAIEDEEIKKFINKELVYSLNEAKIDNKLLENPYYKKSQISDDEFFEKGYIYLEDIGINKDNVNKVEVFSKNTNDYAYAWYEFGGIFYIKDNDTLIVDYKGAYFEVKRNQ